MFADTGVMPIDEEMVFAGTSAAVTRLRLQVERIAPHFRVALLVGECGTGVEAVARRMNSLSSRNDLFGQISADDFAGGRNPQPSGMVLITGLQALEAKLQPRLLQRLNTLAKHTRVLVASECDPRGMVATGRLRAELFERIGTLEIRLAPLRERLDDLPALLGDGLKLDPLSMQRLREYAWPGNLAELAVLKDRLAALGRTITAEDLTFAEVAGEQAVRLDEVIERHVVHVLERVGGNKLRAAEMLGISRSTLYRMLESVTA